jgi:hypothetical protein
MDGGLDLKFFISSYLIIFVDANIYSEIHSYDTIACPKSKDVGRGTENFDGPRSQEVVEESHKRKVESCQYVLLIL